MKLIIFGIILGSVGLNVSAETTWVDDAIKAEIQEETGRQKSGKGSHNIYIVNKNDSEAQAKNLLKSNIKSVQKAEVQNQPETIVEASPLVESYATNLRKMRENAELETEQKIVEKLESARLEDERRRAQRLFGDRKFETPKQVKRVEEDVVTCSGQGCWEPVEQAPIQIIEHRPVVTEAPVQYVEKAQPVTTVHTMDYEKKSHVKKDFKAATFATAGVGGLKYNAENVESKYAWQLGLGMDINEKVSIEGSFAYSQHRVDEYFGNSFTRLGSYGFTDLDQYNWGLEAKYNLVAIQKLNIYAGGYLGLVYRNYFGKNRGSGQFGSVGSDSEENTKSVNVAPVLGAELSLTKKVSIGLDYKYMINMAQKFSSEEMKHSHNSNYEYVPLEEIKYNVISLKAKMKF